jgi:choice-of-anchor A domain-containing protein
MRPFSTRSRQLALESLEARDVPSAYDLGDAAAFNALFFGDMNAFTSDAEGRVAVGGNASLYAYGIGDRLENSNGTRDDLIVGNDLDYTYGQVFNGNIVYGNVGNLDGVGIPNGEDRQEVDVLDFAGLHGDLAAKSALWGAEGPNGYTSLRRGNLNLRGTHAELDIFTVTPDQLAAAKSIHIIAPVGATVLINVPGDSAGIHDLGLHLRGVDGPHILWNFYQADELSISGVGLKGSILAPEAALDFNNGQIAGTVIAGSMHGNGQFNLSESRIHIQFPEMATLIGQVFIDDDGNNAKDPGEQGFDGAEVFLTGRDSLGRRVNKSYMSQNDGQFDFGTLWPGTYAVRVVPPQKYEDSMLLGIPGTVSGAPVGIGEINSVKSIVLAAGDDGIDYLLPFLPPQN